MEGKTRAWDWVHDVKEQRHVTHIAKESTHVIYVRHMSLSEALATAHIATQPTATVASILLYSRRWDGW